jgi:hypothetical protein
MRLLYKCVGRTLQHKLLNLINLVNLLECQSRIILDFCLYMLHSSTKYNTQKRHCVQIHSLGHMFTSPFIDELIGVVFLHVRINVFHICEESISCLTNIYIYI